MRGSGDLLADRRFAYAQGCLDDGEPAAAAEMAEQALERAPRYAPAWLLLGRAREGLAAADPGAREAALAAYAQAARLDPADGLGVRLHLARLGVGDARTAIGPAYVRALFEGYAPAFERHLVEGLHYRGPDLILAELDGLPDAPTRYDRVLDLGCGTGLMGAALAGRAGALVGVDLSPAMLARARGRGLYDRLAEGDLAAFLRAEAEAAYDLVTAADVLIYVADLAPVFAGIARVLRPGGVAAVSVQSPPFEDPCREDGSGGDGPRPEALGGASLGPDGRYAHGLDHLCAAAGTAGLSVVRMARAAVRRERGADVPGRILVLRAAASTP